MESRQTAWKLEHFSIIQAGGNKLFMRCFFASVPRWDRISAERWVWPYRQFSCIGSISKVGTLPTFLPRRSLETEEYHRALHLSPFNWMDLYFRRLKKMQLDYADSAPVYFLNE